MTPFHITEQGRATVSTVGTRWVLDVPPSPSDDYTNAMITSYRSRNNFTFAPHTRMELTANVEGALSGTAGFGFWNHPYGFGMRLPRAIWFFFSSPPSDMPLAMDVPGNGFKAAVFDAQRLLFYMLLPAAPIGMPLMRVRTLYKRLWPLGQRAIGVDEMALDAALLQIPRRYTIEWQTEQVNFMIDHKMVYSTRRVPSGRLGFVAWIDNQYAVISPQGNFRFGLVDVQAQQQLVLENIALTTR